MSRRISQYRQIIDVLEELHTAFPTYGVGRHISTALSDYGDIWGITDKEFLFALEKYKEELSLDISQLSPESYVDSIVKDAMNLFTQEEEDY